MMKCILVAVIALLVVHSAFALDEEHYRQADVAGARGIDYLRSTQNDDGSWMPQPGPAVTAMVVRAMLAQPNISVHDPAVSKAVDYILAHRRDDGAICGPMLANYNTAICLAALSEVKGRADVADAIVAAQDFLRGLQWAGQADPQGVPVDEDHPYYGGAGYGQHGRPDLSNTQIMLEGLHASGLSSDDPAFQRAMVFITRCQGTETNAMFGGQIAQDGGFIYATSIDNEHIGQPQSQAGVDTIIAGIQQPISQLRTYGSMTYAGFKSYLYADLDRTDQRVVDAMNWIRRNYALDHNPGMPEDRRLQGHYYYLLTFARAMRAWGLTQVTTADGQAHDWANDLIAQLTATQRDDGSWTNDADRWMEGDPNLVTAYALLALIEAMR
jgi:squalene-hopene/tetraprenyl-beta-curcumene cyclase